VNTTIIHINGSVLVTENIALWHCRVYDQRRPARYCKGLSVRLSVKSVHCDKRNKFVPTFL